MYWPWLFVRILWVVNAAICFSFWLLFVRITFQSFQPWHVFCCHWSCLCGSSWALDHLGLFTYAPACQQQQSPTVSRCQENSAVLGQHMETSFARLAEAKRSTKEKSDEIRDELVPIEGGVIWLQTCVVNICKCKGTKRACEETNMLLRGQRVKHHNGKNQSISV